MTRSTTDEAAAPQLPSPKERRRLREAKSLSEEQVAAAVGVTRATVRSWETGRTSPRGRKRALYAKLIAPEPEAIATTAPAAAMTAPTPAPKAPETAPEAVPQTASKTAPESAAETAGESAVESAVDRNTDTDTGTEVRAGAEAVGERRLSPAEAFDELYTRTAPGLVRQAYLLTGRRALARESVERAFQLAWHRWPEVAVDRDPAGWIRAAAYEYAMSPWHRLRRAHRHPDAPPTEPGKRALFDALLDLPPAYRRTLLLYDGVGLDLPETAAETEASTPAAAGRLMTARAAVAEQLPELASAATPAEQSALLHDRLGGLARAEHVPVPRPARAVRTGSEDRARLWTRAAVAGVALLIAVTGLTLHTAPTHYEPPISPAERVGGVPPRGGPQKLTAQDLKLQKTLREQLAHGPERLVPQLR
ncbi:DNA-directed RNA polymerase sigma-70 factor [Streptomyces sp. MNU77]|uniref:helix-turn-helix domain-containing protein n=1 Tax=Streptomyces sp. MNU77 TaxID=1573406 RepID=UPI0005E2F416|nr:helix-turn-helix domain-containing protein [Streptomyces sp. MNU77]OLO31367.1 DNA-directed RNA polymerase sigma-70 factor [Streptomyces sp. MNU77]